MEVISTLQSLKQARRQLDEMGTTGNLRPAETYGEWSVDYISDKGITYSIIKKGERQWQIIKTKKGEEAVKS